MACCTNGLVPNRQQAITWTSDNPVCWHNVVSQDHNELKFAIGSCVILWLNWYSWDRNDISFCFTITLHYIIAIDWMINLMSAYWNTANYVGHTVLLLKLAAMHVLCGHYICDILSISTHREKDYKFVNISLNNYAGLWFGKCSTRFYHAIATCHHEMKTFSKLLALCVGNPPVPSGFLSLRENNEHLWWFVCC